MVKHAENADALSFDAETVSLLRNRDAIIEESPQPQEKVRARNVRTPSFSETNS